jgi:hypothetical protein
MWRVPCTWSGHRATPDWLDSKKCLEPDFLQSNRATSLLRRNFWSSSYTGVGRFFLIPT